MSQREHWDAVYTARSPEAVSWYAPHLHRSLALIDGVGLASGAHIIDVGAGTSTLVGDLLDRGHHPTVLDISSAAIDQARRQVADRADQVRWVVGDVTQVELPARHFDLWHDRAVFHFLTDAADRRRYVAAVSRALRPGGYAMVATFGERGPTRCSGLDVVRYSAESLTSEFGPSFETISTSTEVHRTPRGAEQAFVYCLCRSTAEAPAGSTAEG